MNPNFRHAIPRPGMQPLSQYGAVSRDWKKESESKGKAIVGLARLARALHIAYMKNLLYGGGVG